MTNGTPDYQLGQNAATDRHLTAWLERIETKVDGLVWKVAGIATVVPVVITLVVILLEANVANT